MSLANCVCLAARSWFWPSPRIRDLARRIAGEHDLPTDWLNDGVKGYISSRYETTVGQLPQFPYLRLTMPVPEYLLAMKDRKSTRLNSSH